MNAALVSLAQFLSVWAVPVLVGVTLLAGTRRRIPVYEKFLEGAKDAFGTAVAIIPPLVGIMAAVGAFRASGAMDLLLDWVGPVLAAAGFPPDVLPLVFLRPLSGSASLGLMTEIIQSHGVDSFPGRLAAVVQGSTETTFYVLAVYFGAIGVVRYRWAAAAGLAADAAGMAMAFLLARALFGG